MIQPASLVTGASQGLGAAIASIAAANGAQVVLTSRSRNALDKQAWKVEWCGGKALATTGVIEPLGHVVDG